MPDRRRWFLAPSLCWGVLLAFTLLSLAPVQSHAMPVGSHLADGCALAERVGQIETIRQVLEREVVAQRLADYGLTPAEVSAKLPDFSDGQLHQLASLSDSLAEGGILGAVIAVLLIVLLVVVIVKLMDKEIVFR